MNSGPWPPSGQLQHGPDFIYNMCDEADDADIGVLLTIALITYNTQASKILFEPDKPSIPLRQRHPHQRADGASDT